MSRQRPRSLAAALGALALASCDADLESGCLSGPCGPGAQVVPAPSAGDGGECAVTGAAFPVDVHDVLRRECLHCHRDPPEGGAPFSLATYEDTQKGYPDDEAAAEPCCADSPPTCALACRRWQQMRVMIEAGFMPADGPPFLSAEDEATLDAWFEAGAPAAEGAGCEGL